MNKKYTIFAILVFLSIICVLLDNYAETSKIDKANETNTYYVLKSENDVLTLYKGNKFVKCYDFDTTSLPLTDQDNLKSGIILQDMNSVIATLEDFDCN